MKKLPYFLGGAFITFVTLFAVVVHANPSFFSAKAQTGAATTTIAFMGPGTGTTTLTYDAYGLNGTNQVDPGRNTSKAESFFLGIQYTASGTAPTLRMRQEFSDDGIDWYPDNLSISVATTTNIITPFRDYSFTMSTTTDNGGSGTASRVHTSLRLTSPTRFTRMIFSVPTGGGTGGLWAQVVPNKERGE